MVQPFYVTVAISNWGFPLEIEGGINHESDMWHNLCYDMCNDPRVLVVIVVT